MTQTENTATETATAEKSADFKCSCGRTFAHEISLKRHRWVTGHAEAEPEAAAPVVAASAAVETPAPSVGPALLTTATELPLSAVLGPSISANDAYEAAMEALLAKTREQQSYERRARTQAILDLLVEFFQWMLGLAATATQNVLHSARQAGTQTLQGAAVLARSAALAAGIIALLVGGVTAGRALAGSPEPTPAPVPAPAAAERPAAVERELVGANLAGPEATVESFYSALDSDDYQSAYSQLSSDWKRQLPYASFEAGYSQTSSYQVRILGTRGSRVEFTLQTVENGRVHDYIGTYTVVETSHGWQLDAGTLRAR